MAFKTTVLARGASFRAHAILGAAVACLAAAPPPAVAACQQQDILKCYAGDEITGVIKDIAKRADQRGKRMFGKQFQIINRIRYSKYGKTFGGDLDAVWPGQSMVWQAGVTKWTHRSVVSRQDMRYGGVYRFADADAWHGGMLGVWAFMQQDALQGHARAVFGGEYEGRYGTASAAYYAPVSGWRGGRPGYEEAALGGMDVRMRLKLGRKWSARAYGGLWDSTSSSGGRRLSGRLGVDYAPRNWLKWSGGWRPVSGGGSVMSVSAKVKVVLGGGMKVRRYRKPRAADYTRKLLKPAARLKRILVRERTAG